MPDTHSISASASGTARSRNKTPIVALGVAALAAGVAFAALQVRNGRKGRPPDSAPGRTAKGRGQFGDYAVVGRTVTINKPRAALYAFWRDFRNLPRFMENIESVVVEGDRTVWTISAPMGRAVKLETEIVEERENELIAWRSVEGSEIDAEGRVTFRDAPKDRGTRVEAIVAYKPPAGELGRLVAKLFRREPEMQGRHELKRFKMLMETGEIASSENRREAA